MQRSSLILIGIGLVLFISAVTYIVRYQTSSVHEIFKHHREQLENEIKAIDNRCTFKLILNRKQNDEFNELKDNIKKSLGFFYNVKHRNYKCSILFK
jgi:hypothetical protein